VHNIASDARQDDSHSQMMKSASKATPTQLCSIETLFESYAVIIHANKCKLAVTYQSVLDIKIVDISLSHLVANYVYTTANGHLPSLHCHSPT